MGLFGSKSKSTTNTSTQNNISYSDSSKATSGTIGAASSGNIISGGDVYGYNASDTNKILTTLSGATTTLNKNSLDAMKDVYKQSLSATSSDLKTSLNASRNMLSDTLQYVDRALADVKETSGAAMSQVASAYAGANNAILQNQSETAALFSQLKPFALYALVGAVAYFITKARF